MAREAATEVCAQTTNTARAKVTLIGAGPAGCLMSVYLARQGYELDVYEASSDQRITPVDPRGPMPLTLCHRGITSLENVGVAKAALGASVPLRGRMVHRADGEASFQAYGTRPHELLYAVRRGELLATLLDAAVAEPGVRVHFDTRCIRIDPCRREALLEDQVTGRCFSVTADHIVGADGAFSAVRRYMQNSLGTDSRHQSLNWGYKDINLSAEECSEVLMTGALHVWPRGDRMLLAIPNADGSFLCTCVLPFQGPDSLETLTTPADVSAFLEQNFGDLGSSIESITEQFLSHPALAFTNFRTSPWHYRGNVVLIGDACHTTYPFYGQGLNSALEDCAIWSKCLDAHSHDWHEAAASFQAQRKPSTDALVELSAHNFVELRDTAASRRVTARKRVNLALARWVPVLWVPLYTMVSHSTMPYDAAVRRARRQDQISRWLGVDLVILIMAGLSLARDRFTWQVRQVKRGPRKGKSSDEQ